MNSPTRRNRNIGTAKQGHGQDNEMRIPESWWDHKIYYEKLNCPTKVTRSISGKDVIFLVEPTLSDYTHPCTLDDIEQVLGLVPDSHYIDLVILRQPTRNQDRLNPVWGRMAFYYEADQGAGTAIVLESKQVNVPFFRSKSLDPDSQDELDRLRQDGHQIILGKRQIKITPSLESTRQTQLFRTVPHEIGHYVDLVASGGKHFDKKTHREKEAFAHRYADEFRSRMEQESKFPFERILNKERIEEDGLDINWFQFLPK